MKDYIIKQEKKDSLMDIAFLGLGFLLFGSAILLVKLCNYLSGGSR